MKTIDIFRHSKPVKQGQFSNSDIPLSAEGKEKILNLATEMQLGCNLKIYTSPYRRAFETAELIACNPICDDRLIERGIGERDTFTKEIWRGQYVDATLRNIGGESFFEVRARVSSVICEILCDMHDDESVIVVSHAAAICAYLQQFCAIIVTDADSKQRQIKFHDRVIMEGAIQSPSCFKLDFEQELIGVTYYE